MSFIEFLKYSKEKKDEKIENAIAEAEIEGSVSEDIANYYGRRYVENEFKSYSNSYLKASALKHLGLDIDIVGKSLKLCACPCCGYKTLLGKCEYLICEVCYWEDDGSSLGNANKYSSPNRMTLNNARTNFEKFGVIAIEFLKCAEEDRMFRFEKPQI